MSESQGQKRRGRPPKAEADRKDGNLTFRTRAGLRERLAAEALKSGRSISEEIEVRLESTFFGTNLFLEFETASIGGEFNRAVAMKFAFILYDLQLNADNLGGDRKWPRERTKALIEEKGASEMIPALLAHFPFPPDTNPHPEDVRREEERERTRKLHEQKAMRQAQK